jgi:hypothetical protein
MHGCSLFFEKSLQRSFGLFDPVGPPSPSLGSSQNEIIAEIGSFFIYDSLSRDFAAGIIGIRVIVLALLTASKIAMTVRAGVFSPDGPANVEATAAKSTTRDFPFFNQRATLSPCPHDSHGFHIPNDVEADARTNNGGQLY